MLLLNRHLTWSRLNQVARQSSTPVTPGFANGPNSFSFSCSLSPINPQGLSGPLAELIRSSSKDEESSGSMRRTSQGGHPILRGLNTLAPTPAFGSMNGLHVGGKNSRDTGTMHRESQDNTSGCDEVWSDRELDLLESVRHMDSRYISRQFLTIVPLSIVPFESTTSIIPSLSPGHSASFGSIGRTHFPNSSLLSTRPYGHL
jgi:hypothetical protein